MRYQANDGRSVTIRAGGRCYARHVIQPHFITLGEDYVQLVRHYVAPLYRPGDILSISEKVISLCQGRVVTEEDCRPGFWAKVLARCVHQTPAGPGMGLPHKMQFAIRLCGLGRVLLAAVCAALGKLVGKHGIFYAMLDREVAGLDGFYGKEIPAYAHIGIRLPAHPGRVCEEIWDAAGIPAMIVDANDLNAELLGKAAALDLPEQRLLALIADNPAGQGAACTPFVLIRPISPDQVPACEAARLDVRPVPVPQRL